MSFARYALTKTAGAIGGILMLPLIFMYGITMFGLLSGSNAVSSQNAPYLGPVMFSLTGLWVGSLALIIMYNGYTKGDMSGKIPIALGLVCLAATILGGVIPLFYAEFIFNG